MPTYVITAPDGKEYEITGEGSKEEALAYFQSQWGDKGQQIPMLQNQQPQQQRNMLEELTRQLGLTARAGAEGVVDMFSPFADVLAGGMNLGLKATGSDYRFPEQSQAFSNVLTQAGVPEPHGTMENIANFGGRLGTGMTLGTEFSNAVLRGLGLPTLNTTGLKATTEGGKILEKNQIQLDRAQRTDNRFLYRLRAALNDNPITTENQQSFNTAQQKQFNRAVLRSIGEDADEATQTVMSSAKERISGVFNRVGEKGAKFDDVLQSQIADIADEAARTVPESSLRTFSKNVDDLLNAVDESGNINGKQLIKIRSHLSKLSKNSDVSEAARSMEDAILDALERSHPGERAALRAAKDQWRSLRIIDGSIDKGLSGDISPLRLSNAIATKSQRNMSVYGLGGDQDLVSLAKAGRNVLGEGLPQSGTIPRGLMQAPLQAIPPGIALRLFGTPYMQGQGLLPNIIPRKAILPPLLGAANRELNGE